MGSTAMPNQSAMPPAAIGSIALGGISQALPTLASGQRLQRVAAQPLFAGLPPATLTGLAEAGRLIVARRGDYVVRRGQACEGFYIVVSGQLQLLLEDEAGAARLLAVMEAGRGFGAEPLFMPMPFATCARAAEETVLLLLPRAAVLTALQGRPDLPERLLQHVDSCLQRFVTDICAQSQRGADSRVAEYLLDLSAKEGAASYRLPLSKRIIAARLGLAPETLSRSLRQLKESGLVQVAGYRVDVLDSAGLARIAAS
jgi:CRP-like cAMP-binding protein